MNARFTLDYWRDGEWFVGRLREVPGVFSQGETLSVLEANIKDAYRLVMADQKPVRRSTKSKKVLIVA
ncbi:MAG: type II toxin-antitoxin system HicB family antitoxin [Elusimicrobia bacterium]|nr:type II toxin-antitoxin system HicB family antitoxin [Elusimicrobiota bacterium]